MASPKLSSSTHGAVKRCTKGFELFDDLPFGKETWSGGASMYHCDWDELTRPLLT